MNYENGTTLLYKLNHINFYSVFLYMLEPRPDDDLLDKNNGMTATMAFAQFLIEMANLFASDLSEKIK